MTTPITVREGNPSLLIQPANDRTGHCPTLLVDGIPFHDPVQPYKEVLPLEGATPEVVVLFGVGMGYTAAGMLQLAPQARVLAWEPIPGLADFARLMVNQEWKLGDRVVIEQDLADFQARLMEAAAGATSMAVVELQALAAREPGLLVRFRDTIREVVAASTFGALPSETDGERWAQMARNASRLASLPRFASLAGTLPGSTAILVTGPPLKSQISRIKEASPGALVLCVPSALPGLSNAGIQPHLVLAHDRRPPGPEVQWGLAGCWLAVTPDSDPGWLDIPSGGTCLFGHSATAWLFPPNDMAHIISFRWGNGFPLAAAAAALGVSHAFHTGPMSVNGDPWNLLAADARSELTGRLCLMGNGGELRPLPPTGGPSLLPPLPREQVLNRWKQAARPLGAATLRNGVTRARLAMGRLIRERHRCTLPLLWEDLRRYLGHRVEGDPFTRSFVKPLLSVEPLTPETIDHRLEGTQGYLDWIEQGLPASAPKTGHQDLVRHLGNTRSFPLFIGGGWEDFIPQRVLLATLDSLAGTRIEVRFLVQEVQARFGSRAEALPVHLWPLLIPELCQNRGKALFIDPAVIPLEDPRNLFDLSLDGRVALVPSQGPPLLALMDCGRAPWSVDQVLSDPGAAAAFLKPGGPGKSGSLPEIWSFRDSVRMDTAAVHFTCTPWLPWIQDLHPLRWLWEYHFANAVSQGYLTLSELEKSVEKGILRAELAERMHRQELFGPLSAGAEPDLSAVASAP